MNREKAREYLTHRLAGELTEEEARELEEFLRAHPEFSAEVQRLEGTWARLGRLESSHRAAPPMGPELKGRLADDDRTRERAGGRRSWWAFAAAALVLLALGLGLLRMSAPGKPSPAAQGDDFAGMGAVHSVQRVDVQAAPRVRGVRGLALVRGPGDARWRLLRRGDQVPLGHTVRVGENPRFGASLLSDDGTEITLAAGSELRVEKATVWRLNAGAARVVVGEGLEWEGESAERPPERIHLRTPHGWIAPRGTRYAVRVGENSTLCRVSHGEVILSAADRTRRRRVSEGSAGIIEAGGVRLSTAGGDDLDALLDLERGLDTSQAVARLVAKGAEEGEKLPLEIQSYDVKVSVVDGVARTFIDMVFINHTSRRLEGTFYYNVPSKAVISEFAMYVGNRRVVGEVLERHRARQIFEHIRRERRDPALLEWVGGNQFKMRVFPIEPRSTKRIQLGYTRVLDRRSGKVSYNLPLVSQMLKRNPLQRFSIEADILSTPGLSDLQCPSHDARIETGKEGRRASVHLSAEDYTPRRDFHLSWEVPDDAECVALSNRRPEEEAGYFMLQLDPRVSAPEREVPERLLVVLDGSASVDPRAFNVARQFVMALCSMAQGWELNVVLTGAEADPLWDDFQVVDWETPGAVDEFLAARTPLGGTDLLESFRGVADLLEEGRPARVIYVGDGIDTLGRLEGAALVEAIREQFEGRDVELSCVAVGSSFDREVLGGLAAGLGGTFRAVQGATDVFDAADRVVEELFRPILRDVKVAFEGVKVGAVYPAQLGTLAVGDTGIVLGRFLEGETGTAVVTGTSGGEPFRRRYDVDLPMREDTNEFLPRLWAKAHMDALRAGMGQGTGGRDDYLRDQIIAVSLEYQIMSPYTAFLVLESEEDYRKYGVVRRLRRVDWRGETDGVSHRRAGGTRRPQAPVRNAPAGPVVPLPEPSAPLLRPDDASYRGMESGERGAMFGRGGFGGGPPAILDMIVQQSQAGSRLLNFADHKREIDALFLGRAGGEIRRRGRWGVDRYLQTSAGADPFFDATMGQAWPSERGMIGGVEPGRAGGDLYGRGWSQSGRALHMRRNRRPASFVSGPESAEPGAPGYYRHRPCRDYFRQHGITRIKTDDGESLKVRHAYLDELHARRAVLLDRDDLQRRLDLAVALACAGRHISALVQLRRLEEAAGGSFHLWMERAWLENQLGREDAAHESLKRAERALENVAEDQRTSFRANLASQLRTAGKHGHSVRIYLGMARSAAEENQAISYYCTAWAWANAAPDLEPDRIADELLERFPRSGPAHLRLAQYARSSDPELALALLDEAEARGQDVAGLRIEVTFATGRTEEAWRRLRAWFAETGDASDAQRALQVASRYDPARAGRWCEEAILAWEESRLTGALRYAGHTGRLTVEVVEKVEQMMNRGEIEPDHRLPIFNLLHRGSARRTEWAELLVPLLRPEPASTEESEEETSTRRARSFEALGELVTHAYHGVAKPYLLEFEKLEDLTDSERLQLVTARWKIERKTGDRKRAVQHLLEAFGKEKNAGYAHAYVQWLIGHFIRYGKYDRAIGVLAEKRRRFPNQSGDSWMVRSLYRHIRNMPELLRKARKALAVGTAQVARERVERIRSQIQDGALSKADSELTDLHRDLEDRIDGIERRLSEMEERKTSGAGVGERKLMRRRSDLLRMLAWARRTRARVAARRADLRRAFLDECRRRAQDEDPVAREWTNAALACLRAAGRVRARTEMLDDLHRTEPQDPIWGRLLVNARVQSGELEKALRLVERLREQSPDDVALLRTWHSIVRRVGTPEEAEAATGQLLDALEAHPDVLNRLARWWQKRERNALAVRAWLRLQKTPPWRQNGYPALEAAELLEEMGRGERATELLLELLADPLRATSRGQSVVDRLADLIRDERNLPLAEKRLEDLTGAEDPAVRRWSTLLAYRAARIRDDEARAQRLLSEMMGMPADRRDAVKFPVAVVLLLRENGRYQDAATYARDGAEGISPRSRAQLLRNAASWLGQLARSRRQAIELYRELTERGSSNVHNDRRKLIQNLTEAGRMEEAWEELKEFGWESSDWPWWQAFRTILRAEPKAEIAVSRGIAAWRRRRARHGSYGDNVWRDMIDRANAAIGREELSESTRDDLAKVLVQHVRDVLSSASSRSYIGRALDLAEKLDVLNEVEQLIEEAASSDDPERMLRAADYLRRLDSGGWWRAADIWRSVLWLEGSTPRQVASACSSLYRHATAKKQWSSALEMLRMWRETGLLDEPGYLQRRVYCLYQLEERKEARALVEKLLAHPAVRARYSGDLSSLASHCHQAEDYVMEAKVREHQFSALILWSRRRNRSLDVSSAARFLEALARACAEQGKIERAVESCVRGLQIVDRHDHSHYYERLRRTLVEILTEGDRGGVDAALHYYERKLLPDGEIPRLRVALGEAYREAGEQEKALAQFSVAAELMPKDTELRREVIEGYRRLDRPEDVEKAYLAWAQLDPQNIVIYRKLGQFYERRGRSHDALRAYATMPEVRPREAEGHRAYAKILAEKGELDGAITHYVTARKYRPTEFEIAAELAEVYRRANREEKIARLWADGEAACRRAMKDLSDDPLPWLNLARYLKARGKTEQARAQCNRILRRDWPRFGGETREEAREILDAL